jgi:hypothetical protein
MVATSFERPYEERWAPIDTKGSDSGDCLTITNALALVGTSRRNSIAMAYMLAVDESYDQFESSMLEEARVGNFVASITSLG